MTDTTVTRVLAALADPTRREIFEQLADRPRAVGELAGVLPVSRPAVSQHLKVLREASLVSVRAAGTRRIYGLDHAGLDAARAWLARLADPLEPFTQPLDALATELARGRRARRAARPGQPVEPAAGQGSQWRSRGAER